MTNNQSNALKISQKLDLLTTLFNNKSIRPILDKLNTQHLVEAHQFLWDKLVEIHYLTQSSDFSREKITKKMIPSAAYQNQQGCDLSLDYCKGVECVWANPECAGNKVKNNMEVMGKIINEYFQSCRKINSQEKRADFKKEKLWF